MNDFVIQFPSLTISVLLALIAIIGWLVRQAILNLNATMQAIIKTVNEVDKRLTVQETICDKCRKSCPEAHN